MGGCRKILQNVAPGMNLGARAGAYGRGVRAVPPGVGQNGIKLHSKKKILAIRSVARREVRTPRNNPRPSRMHRPTGSGMISQLGLILSRSRTTPMRTFAFLLALTFAGLAAGQAKNTPPKEAPIVPPREGKSETKDL